MRAQPRDRIHRDALNVWRIHGAIEGGIACLAAIGAFAIALNTDMPIWIAVIVACLALIFTYVMTESVPNIRWKLWRYEVREDEIDLQRGVLVVKRTLVPMVRVQHVDTKQGPILRKYGLASVTVSTAATVHEIPALSERDAALLRDRIAELARVVDDDE
ncbi:MAG TPA: PH domain-containing protein [Bacillales bacterium]|nr:PH domain-containing protein [Bacillales bacterium]